MKVQFAADPAGQKRFRAAIFGIADDRMADCRHVRAKLVRSPGQRLKLDPGGAIAGAVDLSVAGFGGTAPSSSSTCIFSPPVPGCLASGKSIMPSSGEGTPTTSAQ